ncbi:MAG: tetratricopeptide repeat protein, partial [Atribacterota bacterium]
MTKGGSTLKSYRISFFLIFSLFLLWCLNITAFADEAQDAFTLGNDLFQQERYQEALNAYQKAAQLKPEGSKVYISLG